VTDGFTPAQQKRFNSARASLDVVRIELESVELQTVAVRAELDSVEAMLDTLRTRGATARQIDAAAKQVTIKRDELGDLGKERLRVEKDFTRVRDRLDRFDPIQLDPAWSLSAQMPLALLPVRIETRFVANELRIRIFPDVIHIDQLEPQLTADEEQYGHEFWAARWTVTGTDITACWERFARGHAPQRLAWIVEQTIPTNFADIGRGEPVFPTLSVRPPGPSRAPTARLLPGRFVAIGFRNGAEAFRKWGGFVPATLNVGVAPSDASAAAPEVPLDVQPELAIDDASKWLVDYGRAEQSGMAITIRQTDVAAPLNEGFERVVVVGVDHRSDPAGTASGLDQLLRAHQATDGLGFVDAGTPTNATSDSDVAARPIAGDPTAARPALGPTTAAITASTALGLSPTGALSRAVGAESIHDPLGQSMRTALWEPTLGYFVHQMMAPLVTAPRAAELRDHMIHHVRPRGPLPLARVGRQPLGILPVVALGRYKGGPADGFVADVLRSIRPFWSYSADTALRLGDSGDPAADLVELLERTDHSVAYRLRQAIGPVTLANTEGGQVIAAMQQAVAQLTLAIAGVTGRPRIVDVTVAEDHFVAPIPLVTGDPLSDVAPLASDYVSRIADRLATRGGVLRLWDDPEQASTLLEAMLIHAADLEVARASMSIVIDHLQLPIDIDVALADPEFRPDLFQNKPGNTIKLEMVDQDTPVARLNVSAGQIAQQQVAEVTGRLTMESYLADMKPVQLAKTPTTRQLGEFRAALAALRGQPTTALHRAAAESLDAVSHRFDAWATSLATARLAAQRTKAATGVHVGAFGWVDDLHPATARASAGFVHAPSIPQATTAAVLRSGHLGRTDANAEALAIDLTSRRVRDACKLVEGIRGGQSLGALLGYRYERGLRDRSAALAAFILPSRLRFPLPGSGDSDQGGLPVEAIAARNVVDGVALAELDAAGRQAFLSGIGVAGAQRDEVVAELDELTGSLDAVADLLVAEGVFQAVVGNSDRAAAALDALDRQLPVPEIGVGRTPRSGAGIGHRVLVMLDDERPPSEWRRLTDTRGNAEPRVNAWIAGVLGDPGRFRFGADALGDDGGVLKALTTDLGELGMSPLALVMAASHGSDQVSEFEERLSTVFAAQAPEQAVSLRAHAGPAPGSKPGSGGLTEFMAVARGIADLVGSARAVMIGDLAHPNERRDPVPDVAELASRADDVAQQAVTIAATDDELSALTKAEVIRLLRLGAELGIRGALPRSDDRVELEAQLGAVVTVARAMRDRLTALDTALAALASPTDHALAAHHEARIRAVLGEQMPVVPVLVLPADLRDMLNNSLADSALLGKSVAVATEWVLQHTRVRPSIERLWAVLATAEARVCAVDATQFAVAQLPVRAGDLWVGRADAFDPAGPAPVADTSLVIHRTAPSTELGTRVAGLMVDQWFEQVPGAMETTGVAFHYDGPGARPPQTMLLAVHPDPAANVWSTDVLVDTIVETADLARIRTLDLDDVSAAGRFLPAAYLAFNLEREVPMVDFGKLIGASLEQWVSWKG